MEDQEDNLKNQEKSTFRLFRKINDPRGICGDHHQLSVKTTYVNIVWSGVLLNYTNNFNVISNSSKD